MGGVASADVEVRCPSAWHPVSAYGEIPMSVVSTSPSPICVAIIDRTVPMERRRLQEALQRVDRTLGNR